jgi:CubicO group peptidase (beta-lactamase class C family)
MNPKKNSQFPLPFADPEEVGFIPERLARIDQYLQKYIDRKTVPHLVTLVARHGKIVHFSAQGHLSFEGKEPAGKDTIARLYSNSKPIAGVAAMICVEEGLLNLDYPLSKFIPDFKNPVVMVSSPDPEVGRPPAGSIPTVPANREITVRDCLRNTTGLLTAQRAPAQYLAAHRETAMKAGWFSLQHNVSVREMVEAQASLPLAAQPGTEFVYHVGYPALGLVLEAVTGQSLEEFYQQRIFGPLGMKDTSFYLPKNKLNRFPPCYRAVQQGPEWKLIVFDKPDESEKVTGPKVYFGTGGDMGGLLSTVGDYARFAQMLLNAGELDGVRILGRKSVELMTRSHTAEDLYIPMSGPGFGFGLGVGVYKGGGLPQNRSVGTFGWGGAAGTTFFVDPKEDLFAICFTQVMGHWDMPGNTYQEEFERLVYQALA